MQALTHKLWAKEYLVSTNQAELTDIAQHAMCGVTNELLKPGADPRRLIKLAEQLRSIANSRARDGLDKEAHVALKQAELPHFCSVSRASAPICLWLQACDSCVQTSRQKP
jgi:hypothetical protein